MAIMSPDACKWRDILLSASYPARNKKRVNAIARILAGNKFRRLEHLARAPPVSQWLYTHRLLEDEHMELQAFCDGLTELPAAIGRMPLAVPAPAAAAAVPALSLHVFVPVHDASAPHLHTPDKHRLANILVLTAA